MRPKSIPSAIRPLCAAAALFCALLCAAVPNPAVVARGDYNVPPRWRIQPIQGRDFNTVLSTRFSNQGDYWQAILLPGVFRPLDEEAPFIRELAGSPLFQNSGMSVEPSFQLDDWSSMEPYNKGEAFTTGKMLGASERQAADAFAGRNAPLIVRDWAPRPFPMKMNSDSFVFSREDYERFLAAHPNFLTFDMGEWDNEYINLHYYLDIYQKLGKVSEETAARIKADFLPATTNEEYVARLQKAFERKKALYFGDAKRLSFMNAGWNLAHLAAYWGAGMVTLETSNSGGGETYYRWQVGMAYTRGAARQYGIPWMWYIASCLNGYTADSKWVSSYEPGFDSNNGVGPSWLNRCFYLAYYGGANLMELEHWYLKILAKSREDDKDFRLSRIGEHFINFRKFAEANPDRGTPYTPIALLAPFRQAYPQWGGNPWGGAKPYTRDDFALDAFWATLIPAYDRVPALKRGEQGALFNSPYGDLVDVVIPDAPEARDLANVLEGYKVVIVAGDIDANTQAPAALEAYVRHGGTLVLDATRLDRLLPAAAAGLRRTPALKPLAGHDGYLCQQVHPDGAQVLLQAEDGAPVFTLHRHGQGNVLVCCVPDWVPSMTADSISHTRRGILTFPFIRQALEWIVADVLPFRVEGDIQYGATRTADGFIVYLINNRGVTKMADTPETVDEGAAAEVALSWTAAAGVTAAEELRGGEALAIDGQALRVTVPPGDVRVVRLHGSFPPR